MFSRPLEPRFDAHPLHPALSQPRRRLSCTFPAGSASRESRVKRSDTLHLFALGATDEESVAALHFSLETTARSRTKESPWSPLRSAACRAGGFRSRPRGWKRNRPGGGCSPPLRTSKIEEALLISSSRIYLSPPRRLHWRPCSRRCPGGRRRPCAASACPPGRCLAAGGR